MNRQFLEYCRCPSSFVDLRLKGEPLPQPGFFQMGSGVTCYGRISSGPTAMDSAGPLEDVSSDVRRESTSCLLPFDLDEVVENLRFERYNGPAPAPASTKKTIGRKAYYAVRPYLPTSV